MNKLLVIAAIAALFSTPAFAQTSSSGSGFLSLLPLIIIGVIYFFLLETSTKEAKNT